MRISGTGITPFNTEILPSFKPITILAYRFQEKSNGDFEVLGRGPSADIYESEIALINTEATLNTFLSEVQANRVAESFVIVLDRFEANPQTDFNGEQIFGSDIDHGSIEYLPDEPNKTSARYTGTLNCTVIKIDDKAQRTLRGFSLKVRLRSLSPGLTGSAALPTFKNLDFGYKGNQSYFVKKNDSYDGTFSYIDKERDIGIFTGVFVFTDDVMRDFRAQIRLNRGQPFQVDDISGVSFPFGPDWGDYPYLVRLLKWEDLGMRGVGYWKMKITLITHLMGADNAVQWQDTYASGTGYQDTYASGTEYQDSNSF